MSKAAANETKWDELLSEAYRLKRGNNP